MAKEVVLIAGNICAGKSEFVSYVRENSGLNVVTEGEFTDPVALALFYKYRAQYTDIFELSNLVPRVSRYLKAKHDDGKTYFFDRGMIEGAETFCRNSFEEGYLTHEAYENYINILKHGLDKLGRAEQETWLERLIVYFRVPDVRILQQRQQKRSTVGEVIPAGYLERINEKYELFFANLDGVYTKYGVRPPEVLMIDATVDFCQDTTYHRKVLEKITTRLVELEHEA